MRKVYIPQVVTKFDEATQHKTSTYDFSPAMVYGELVEVLGPDDNPALWGRMMPKIRDALKDFKDGDYILAVGNPCVMMACAMILAQRFNKLSVLQWDRKMRTYVVVEVRT